MIHVLKIDAVETTFIVSPPPPPSATILSSSLSCALLSETSPLSSVEANVDEQISDELDWIKAQLLKWKAFNGAYRGCEPVQFFVVLIEWVEIQASCVFALRVVWRKASTLDKKD